MSENIWFADVFRSIDIEYWAKTGYYKSNSNFFEKTSSCYSDNTNLMKHHEYYVSLAVSKNHFLRGYAYFL